MPFTLRKKLYGEYSNKLQDAADLLKETYGKMSETTGSAFREVTAAVIAGMSFTSAATEIITINIHRSFS